MIARVDDKHQARTDLPQDLDGLVQTGRAVHLVARLAGDEREALAVLGVRADQPDDGHPYLLGSGIVNTVPSSGRPRSILSEFAS